MYITWNHMSYWPRNTLSFSIHFSRNWIRQMHKCWTWKTMVFNWSTCTTWNSLWWMLEKWNLYMGTLYSWWKWWKLYPTITYSNYYYSLAKSYNLIFYSTYYRYLILFLGNDGCKEFFLLHKYIYFINSQKNWILKNVILILVDSLGCLLLANFHSHIKEMNITNASKRTGIIIGVNWTWVILLVIKDILSKYHMKVISGEIVWLESHVDLVSAKIIFKN